MDNSFRTDFLDILWYKDGYGDKVSREITNEGHIVTNGLIVLDEIPDAFYKVEVAGMYETDIKNSLISAEFFKVDYDHAKIYFHPELEGKTVNVSRYFSRGIIKLSAKRVFDEIDGQILDSNKIDKTLQDFINSIKSIQFEEFDASKVYTPNKCVLYHGSTFRCIKTTFNHELPINTEYWQVITAGFNYRGEYENASYDLRDVVSYTPERAIYICIKPTDGTQLPTNEEYWYELLSLKNEVDFAIEKANLADAKAKYATEQGDYAKTQGNYAKQEGDILSGIIDNFTYIGEYNSTIGYVPKNVVLYNGSTYINKVACSNILPTNTEYWQILASGFVYKGNYSNATSYELRDMVYYEPEKTIYFCIKPSKGNVPTNTTYWIKSLSVKSETDYAKAQGDYAKSEGNKLDTIINEFNYIGDYDETINYQVKNMVKYHGSTYINTVACKGILPTDTTHWRALATGYVFKGEYKPNEIYEERDIVYYGIEKTLYECINQADKGISPYNIGYWKPMINVEHLVQEINDYINDTTSLYVSHDVNIVINHGLNKCPRAFAYTLGTPGFGNGSYGEAGYGGTSLYEVLTKGEYPDLNTIKIYLNEQFNGTPTITTISATEYQVDFSNDISIKIELY